MEKKRLYKTEGSDRKLCGVCGGVAEYLEVDPTLVRVIWVLVSLGAGFGVLAYGICALIMPNKSEVIGEF